MRHIQVLKAVLAGVCGTSLAIAATAARAEYSTAPEAERARSAADAAKAVAEAAQAAATAAAPPPAPTTAVITAPVAPTAPPVLTFAAAPAAASTQDLLGTTEAMPVASARLLATLTAEPAAVPTTPAAPSAPTAMPGFVPAVTAPLPPAPPPAPIAPPTVLAALGAAPVALPTAAALEAAIAAQTTPIPTPAPVYAAPVYAAAPVPAPAPRVQYAAATYAPRSRRNAGTARFTRAVVSTAAVSVEMPDASSQISPLGIMLGQLVRTQETPGTQYGFAEEMTMPTRPRLMAMPEVALPQSFCSAEQRGAFVEGIYQPALAIARHNSEIASAYVRKLRTLYDNYQLSGDGNALSAVAAEAREFLRTANAAGAIQEDLSSQFEDIMTTPLRTCGANQ